jgi:hypothetical protein
LRRKLPTIALSTKALEQAAQGDPQIQSELDEPWTQDLMQYIVSCALAPGRSVVPPVSPDAGLVLDPGGCTAPPGASDGWRSTAPWPGELGLCDAWATAPPSVACQQIVSSCVLARVNAVNKRVIISLRGAPTELFPLQPQVAVETQYRERTTDPSTLPAPLTPIHSFEPTCVSSLAGDPTRNCAWAPLYVGRCTAGDAVKVCAGAMSAAGAACQCDRSDPQAPMLRVCKGLYGCDDGTGAPAPAGPPPVYAGFLGDAPACESLEFVCPDDGPLVDTSPDASATGQRYGYFSVMAAPQAPLPTDAGVDAGMDAGTNLTFSFTFPGEYPAPEVDAFTYREGAFYGNLFDSKPTEPLFLPEDLFACYSDTWTCGLALMTGRFCAGAGASSALCQDAGGVPAQVNGCFDQDVPRPCSGGADPTCQSGDGGPADYYQLCAGGSGGCAWSLPITVYLNHPCDLLPSDEKQNCQYGAIRNQGIPPQ